MELNQYVGKKYAEQTVQELADAPLHALTGISKKTADMLEKEFNVTTISGFSRLGFVQAVNAIMAALDAVTQAQEAAAQELLDDALAMSFPSSDPVSVTSAIRRMKVAAEMVEPDKDHPCK